MFAKTGAFAGEGQPRRVALVRSAAPGPRSGALGDVGSGCALAGRPGGHFRSDSTAADLNKHGERASGQNILNYTG